MNNAIIVRLSITARKIQKTGRYKTSPTTEINTWKIDWSKQNEKNLSAQEKTQKDGARLQKKNGNKERTQGSCPQTFKGPQTAHLLIR